MILLLLLFDWLSYLVFVTVVVVVAVCKLNSLEESSTTFSISTLQTGPQTYKPDHIFCIFLCQIYILLYLILFYLFLFHFLLFSFYFTFHFHFILFIDWLWWGIFSRQTQLKVYQLQPEVAFLSLISVTIRRSPFWPKSSQWGSETTDFCGPIDGGVFVLQTLFPLNPLATRIGISGRSSRCSETAEEMGISFTLATRLWNVQFIQRTRFCWGSKFIH